MLDTSDTPISTVNASLLLQFKSERNVLTTFSTAILSSTDTAWVRVSLLYLVQWCPDFRGRALKTVMPNQLHPYWDAQQHTSTSLTFHSSTSAQVHTYLSSGERPVWESKTHRIHSQKLFWEKHTALNVISVKLSLNLTGWRQRKPRLS